MSAARRLLVFLLTSLPVTAAAEPLRLDDAVHQALARNERALKAPLRIESAEGSLDRARDAFFPSLVAGAQYGINSRATTTTGTLTLTQPLFAPSAFPLYSQAKHNLAAERWGAEQDLRNLAFDTARAFFQTLAAERVLQAAPRRLDTAKANLDYAEARVGSQLASSNDVTRAQVALASALSSHVGAEANVERAYLLLSFLVGRPVAPGLVTPEATTKAAETWDPGETDVKIALDRRFDVKSAHERTEALRAFAKEPLYRLAPTVSAAGVVRFDLDPIGPAGRQVDPSLAINLQWALFDAGFRYADRKARLAQADSAALDESLLRRSVETDVKIALTSLRAARKQLTIAEEAVTAAQKSVVETGILYNQGLARAIELTEANLNRFDAEVARESARVTMQIAYMDLRQALGLDPIDR